MASKAEWASDATLVQIESGHGVKETVVGNIVIIDALLFFVFMLDRVAVGPMPVGVALCALLGFLGLTRRPRVTVWFMQVLTFAYIAVLAYLAVESTINGVAWQQRLLRFALLFLLMWVVADGRVDVRSAVAGLALAMFVNAVAFYLKLTPNDYPPYLTGWLGDKNVAGLWCGIIGILGLIMLRRGPVMYVWIATFAVLLFLTGSRTSMSAYAAALIWGVARGRLGPFGRVILAGVMAWALNFLETSMARAGVFADREGTDWFRHQIELATAAKLARSPWYGSGLTTAWVKLSEERSIWFHDSYASLRIEGGIPLVIVVVGFVVIVAGGLFGRQISRETTISEMAMVVILVCAWKLGEVFFTSIAFAAYGVALHYRYGKPYLQKRDAWADQVAATDSGPEAKTSFADRAASSLTSDVTAASTFTASSAKSSAFADGPARSTFDHR